MSNKAKNGISVWLFFLFVLNFIYLIYELAFNSRLVDVSVVSLTDAEVRSLELEGRILSGIGLSLLLLRLIKVQGKPLLRTTGLATLAIAIGFPLMFYGQRILVDYLVGTTTAEQRMDAQHLLLLKRGLSNNALQLEGIAFDENDLESAHTRSFLSVLGLMTFVSPDFVEGIKSEADQIIEQVATNEATKALPESYENYRALQQSITQAWEEYKKLSDEYWQAKGALAKDADQSWLELQEQLLADWKGVSGTVDKGGFTRKVLKLQTSLDTYFKAREDCEGRSFRDECIVKVEEIYRTEVLRNLGEYVAPTDWCHEPEVVATTVRRQGRFVTEQREVQQCHGLSFEHLAAKLSELTDKPATYEQFLAREDVSARVREKMATAGISLPEGWQANDRETYLDTFMAKGTGELEAKTDQAMRASLGAILPMNLDAEGFLASRPVQDRLHEVLQPLDENMMIRLDYDPETFRDAIITPHYIALADRERERLYGDTQALADGHPREEEGKRYVRALIVPPIAMGFSLFFALFNAVGLAASIPALLRSQRKWLPLGIKVGGVATIIAVPLANSAAVIETDTYQYFEEETRRSLTSAGSLFTTWVINTEPVVYDIGRLTAYVAPPLLPADPELIASQKKSRREPEIETGLQRGGGEKAIDVEQPAQQTVNEKHKEIVATSQIRELEVVHLDWTKPLDAQVSQAISNGKNAVLVDAQLLSDNKWAIHRSPVISGEGTCLTNFQGAMEISQVDSLQWRAARHGSCGSEELAKRPVSIPIVTDFARQFRRLDPSFALWVHFQPTLLGEVNCHAVRREAENLAATMGDSRFTAAVSSPEVLSCFTRQERDYPLAYFGPEDGDATDDVVATPRHLSLSEVKRLRNRTAGEGYRPYAHDVRGDYLSPALEKLDARDWVIVNYRHADDSFHDQVSSFSGKVGIFGLARELPEKALERFDIVVTRE